MHKTKVDSGMIRNPAVSGVFYPSEAALLRGFMETHVRPVEEKIEAKGVVVPHAGYAYSGEVAAAVYSAVSLPGRFVIMGPNHTGLGDRLAVISEGGWETPLGIAKIDSALVSMLLDACPGLKESQSAHAREHSLEVQLPFLQHLLGGSFSFVPICIGVGDRPTLSELGRILGTVLAELSEPVLLIASSDMNHFESAAITEAKDQMAIERILALDSSGLYDVVLRNDISMCGYGPTIVMLEAARLLGATNAKLIRHSHSGQVTADNRRVVGYAGLAVY